MPKGIATSVAVLALALPFGARAETGAEELFRALGMPRIIEVMREEGVDYGEMIRADLLQGEGGPGWTAVVSDIYDAGAMERQMLEGFESRLEGVTLDPLLAFFQSDRGQRIVELEVSARRAFLDDEVEEAAGEAADALRQDRPDRFELLSAFVEANDLVESNVMGAMNSNYAFYMGLMEGDAFDGDMTEELILSDVWAQEQEIRDDTETWVYSYLTLGYDPLDDDDIEAYIALSRTEEGRALNSALFGTFDDLFVDISRRLGQGAARFLVGEDI
jgi:hypothetical protein